MISHAFQNLGRVQYEWQVQQDIRMKLERKVMDLQLLLNQQPQNNEISELEQSIESLKNQPCKPVSNKDPNYLVLQNQLTELQLNVESLRSLVFLTHQNFIAVENGYKQCFNQLTLPVPSPACISTTAPPVIEEETSTSCAPLGFYTGIRKISLPGAAPFRVLCDSQIAGPGWLVIQRRYDGSVDFYRNWSEYRNGFGQLEGEFFLGLDYIYRLTNYQRHELYIYVQGFNNERFWARYDNFYIGPESEKYRIKSLGRWQGTEDRMTAHLNVDFSTYDRESRHSKLSAKYHGGYWYFKGLNLGR